MLQIMRYVTLEELLYRIIYYVLYHIYVANHVM